MHADRIDVLHVADDDAVVGAVAQDFVLDLFPAEQRGFEQRLVDEAGALSPASSVSRSSRFVVHDAAAGAAERVGRAHDQRIAGLRRKRDALLDCR